MLKSGAGQKKIQNTIELWYGGKNLENRDGEYKDFDSQEELINFISDLGKDASIQREGFADSERIGRNHDSISTTIKMSVPNPEVYSNPRDIIDNDFFKKFYLAIKELELKFPKDKAATGITVHTDHRNVIIRSYYNDVNKVGGGKRPLIPETSH